MKKVFGVILVLLLAVSFLTACGEDKPPEFTLSSVTISPSAPVVNDTVTIKATIANVGEQSGDCDVSLTINGYTDSKSVSSLAGGESSNVSFSYSATTEGSYTITMTTPNDTAIRNFAVMSGDEESFKALPGWTTGWVYECSANDASTENQTSVSSIQNRTLATAIEDSVLRRCEGEDSNRTFEKFVFNNGVTVYWHQRMIGDIIVEQDFVNYQVNTRTEKLVGNLTQWRKDLPESAPNITVTKKQAEDIAGGGNASLFYIDNETAVFSTIDPIPQEPCWVSWKRDDNGTLYNITVVSAQDGVILGYGIPPPASSFIYGGPINQSCSSGGNNCSEVWAPWYDSARYWFEEMGYSYDIIIYPAAGDIKSHIQNYDVALFYGVAHSAYSGWAIDCGCCDGYTADSVKEWIANYPPMRFTFLASCNAMSPTGPRSFAYEFRKGSDMDAVVVGFQGMGQAGNETWRKSCDWQEEFFLWLANGKTVGEAYNHASLAYPVVALYVRFEGDANLRLVPLISRVMPHNAIVGEIRDVNANPLSDVNVRIYKKGSLLPAATYNSDPTYNMRVNDTGLFWMRAGKNTYYTLYTDDMTMLPPYYINLLGDRYVFDFEGNYGLVPKACTMSYAQNSINRWIFGAWYPAEYRLDEWKAMDTIHSWQFPS